MPLILRLSEGTSTLELWSSLPADVPQHPFVPRDVDDAVSRLRDADSRRLRDAADLLGGRTEHDDEGALLVLARAWVEGRLSLQARPHVVGRSFRIERRIIDLADLADPPEPSRPRPRDEETYIEIVLRDELNEPIANEPYEIRLPDGRVVTGRLDEHGNALVEGIKPGSCEVRFPGVHRTELAAG